MPGLVTRRARLLTAALSTAILVPAAAAQADITGTVTTPRGAPAAGVRVEVRNASGGFADSETTNARGQYKVTSSSLTGDPAPYTLNFSKFDGCVTSGDSERTAAAGPVPDGAVADAQLDLFEFCTPFFAATEPTAYVSAARRVVLSPPGGTATLKVLAASSGQNFAITLQDGTPIGQNPSDSDAIGVTAPQAYNGPINLTYSSGGEVISFPIGTLIAAAIPPPAPVAGNIDLETIVDVSGSMGGTDPKFRRKDAVNLVLDLMNRGDKIGSVGFDDEFKPIFDLTTITGDAVIKNLKGLADQRIINGGGTNYNIAFDKVFEALTVQGIDQKRPKGAIFLTDGGHNSGQYNNGHLLFSFNPSGRPWPVCVVQLGTNFQAEDVNRLKRIALETGGQYAATPTNEQLTALYFNCLGRTTGARTLKKKTLTFRQGQTKAVPQKLPKRKLPSATFFVSWGDGTFTLKLKDPKGHIHTSRKPGAGSSFGHGSTYAFFRIRRPIGGKWQMRIRAAKLVTPTAKATARITAAPRR